MILSTVQNRSVAAYDRLDAHYYTSPGVAASERLTFLDAAGTSLERLGDLATVWDPPRFARAYAAPLEPSRPYLRPYDVFDFIPEASDRLSSLRNSDLDRLTPAAGTILQTCSGRNLGPLTVADRTLASFALSHDMIRIEVLDSDLLTYILAFLKSTMGQSLLRRSKSGSVIDHITVADVQAIMIPMTDDSTRAEVSKLMRSGTEHVAAGRERLISLLESREETLPVPPIEKPARGGWTIASTRLTDRLDAAFYEPRLRAIRDQLAGEAQLLGDIASAHLPVRYKRYYVTSRYGRPILSGRQLLQVEPINLRYVSDRSFRRPADYELARGMTVFGAVGRSEGRQGTPALITSDRDGWLASNDVMRLVPKEGVRPGRLWLATAARQTRLQINALSFGSVVDHMNPWDVEKLPIPAVSEQEAEEAEDAWACLTDGAANMAAAVELLEAGLVR